jgi:hypothetical protein
MTMPRDSETALDPALADESVGEYGLLVGAQALDGGHAAAGHVAHFGDAGEHGLLVELHERTAARAILRLPVTFSSFFQLYK